MIGKSFVLYEDFSSGLDTVDKGVAPDTKGHGLELPVICV